jgi:hypothetical protein
MDLFDETSCNAIVYPLAERCSFLNRNVVIILKSIGTSATFCAGKILQLQISLDLNNFSTYSNNWYIQNECRKEKRS